MPREGVADTMKTYTVVYRRDPEDDAWLVEIEGMVDVHTFGRTLDEASVNTREAIAVTVDCEPDEIELEEHVEVAGVDVDDVLRLREQSERLQDKYLQSQQTAARRLAEAGVSRRDSARLLGVSHQRVQQLVSS